MPTIIEIDSERGDQCGITLRGNVDAVMKAIVHGLPREAMELFINTLQAEFDKRNDEARGTTK